MTLPVGSLVDVAFVALALLDVVAPLVVVVVDVVSRVLVHDDSIDRPFSKR